MVLAMTMASTQIQIEIRSDSSVIASVSTPIRLGFGRRAPNHFRLKLNSAEQQNDVKLSRGLIEKSGRYSKSKL